MPSGQPEAPRAGVRRLVTACLREPLVHFAVLGAALFGADYWLAGANADPRTIFVDAAVDAEARRTFAEARGREPNDDELYALRRVWLDNEVLYREGIALRLDEGDPAIRERVIFKALSVIDATLERPVFDEAVLREWFESRRASYDEPARYDFQEAVPEGYAAESELRAFAEKLNRDPPGDAGAGLRIFAGRPRESLVQSYGSEFAAALDALPVGEWHVLASSEGPLVVKLEAVSPPAAAEFDDLRGVVFQDWSDVKLAERRTAAVRALAKKYAVRAPASR